jgi:hypothetical protein
VLNFAEQTGSGAVTVVWSFLTVRGQVIIINKVTISNITELLYHKLINARIIIVCSIERGNVIIIIWSCNNNKNQVHMNSSTPEYVAELKEAIIF